MSLSRRDLRAALAVVAAALALRVGFVLRQGSVPVAGDAIEYQAYAKSLISNGRFEGPGGARATRMPGYPLFLATVETLAGPSTLAVEWAHCLLGALTCLFVYFWARSLFGPPWPLACGLAAACYGDLIFPTSLLYSECLYSFMIAASFCALYAEEFPVSWRAVLGGLGFALTFLVRPEVLPFFLAILCASPLLIKGFTRRGAILAVAVFAVISSAWVARNALVLHRFVPVTTRGESGRYYGLSLPLTRQPIDIGPMYEPPAGADERQSEAGFRSAFLELRARVPLVRRAKAYAFNLLSLYYPFLPQYDWTYALLVPFWLFGLWLAVARRELWPAAGVVVGLSVLFTFVAGPVSRYRFGFAPCLILLAGAGAQGLRQRTRPKTFAWATGAWTAANLTIWLASDQLRHAVLVLKAALWR